MQLSEPLHALFGTDFDCLQKVENTIIPSDVVAAIKNPIAMKKQSPYSFGHICQTDNNLRGVIFYHTPMLPSYDPENTLPPATAKTRTASSCPSHFLQNEVKSHYHA